MNTVQRIFKNTGLLLIAYLLSYVFAFLYTIYSARYLGVENFGILSFALAFTGIIGILSDLGLNTLVTREIARDKNIIKEYTGNIITIKLILSLITFGLIILLVNLMGYSLENLYVVYLIALFTLFSNLSMFFYSIFQAFEKMEYQSIGQILNSLLIFTGVIIGITYKFDLLKFALIYFIAGLIVLAYAYSTFTWKFFLSKPKFNWNLSKIIIKSSLPLSLTFIFSLVYFKIDSIILSLIQGNIAVGIYTASYSLMVALTFIPSVFSLSIYPLLSKFHISSKKSLEVSYQKSFKYLFLISLPIAMCTTFLADKIIILIYGTAFAESIIALQILIWTIPPIFLTYMSRTFLISINKENILLKILFICMIINITLNLIFIPYLSYIGASIITVITELTSLGLCFYYISKYICKIQIQDIIIKPILAITITSLLIYYLSVNNINITVITVISLITYFLSLVLFKVFTKNDINLFKKIIKT
ncbi:flippase [Methanobacterium sp.]|jgi:O-antigen/teichoic acid export membrane protein|uniref:flippase n=1 Tax=Methanobacterium sp. TaxID=2164 RepID=UPI0031592051